MSEPALTFDPVSLPRCEYRATFAESGRFYCRHTRVRVRDHLVGPLICSGCTWHSVPCYLPRPTQWRPESHNEGPTTPEPMVYLTAEQLMADTRMLMGKLPPDVAAVAGIPRSGMLPAALLSALLHVPLYSLCHERGLVPVGYGKRLQDSGSRIGPLLVIDDSVNGGYAMHRARQALDRYTPWASVLYAALYPRPESIGCVDFFARLVPLPHLFEWNLCNCLQAKGIAFDFDGVLCDDYDGGEDDEAAYLEFLRTARPRWLPRRHPVPLIVTARLEKYRSATLQWLARHQVQVRELIMGPWSDVAERRRNYRAAVHKGAAYAATKCSLFVESCERQASEIFAATGRPVLCPTTARIFQ